MIGKSPVQRLRICVGGSTNGGPMAGEAFPRVGFLGAGKMATALARGWLAAGLVTAERVVASDPLPQARQAFQAETGLRAIESNREVVAASDLLILAVKPQTMSALLAEIRSAVGRGHLLVSIAAGVSLRQLADGLGSDRRSVRVMPNTPCLVGASASGYAPGEAVTPE